MKIIRPRLSARTRLTAVYTGLVAICGGILVAVTYTLVAHNLHTATTTAAKVPSSALAAQCAILKRGEPTIGNPADLKAKCAAFSEGLVKGAQTQTDHTLQHLLWYSLASLAAVTMLSAALGWILAGRILRPVSELTRAARDAGAHDLSRRVNLTGPRDELRELADTFDDLLARLEAAFASQRRFIANAGHELRTPLTVMRTTIDVVLAKPKPSTEELTGMGVEVRAAVVDAERLIDSLLTLARSETGRIDREPLDLATLAEDALDDTDPGDLTHEDHLESAPIAGDRVLLQRLVSNVVANAVRHNNPRGFVSVRTATSQSQARLVVENTGPLVPADGVERLFQPFARLNDRTGIDGYGLGLTLVRSIAELHGGSANATARPGGGLVVEICLPRAVALTPNDGQ
ncbi:MAG: HAMP domain-containing histidine kinase [Actinobacteria bacterium]|nr:HAMP domain-containing histidine kinase [Actinomycetota bacterium]